MWHRRPAPEIISIQRGVDLIRRLAEAHRAYGPDPEVCSAATAWAMRGYWASRALNR